MEVGMRSTEPSTFPASVRRTLAIIECAAAGLFLLAGVDGLTTKPTRLSGGGDGIGAGWWALMAVPFLLGGAALAASAYTAWRGGRRWWAWQAALPAVWTLGLLALIIRRIVLDS
jgi:hypothetical protein